jgi:DnaK suppressor protein
LSVDEGDAPKSAQPVASLPTIGGIDALIALQGQDDPAERRRRAVKRGRTALNALDELKIEVLGGTLGPSTLLRLKSATADLCALRRRSARFGAGRDRASAGSRAKMGPSGSPQTPDFSAYRAAIIPCLSGTRRSPISSPREQGGSFRVGWGEMKNKKGIKDVNGHNGANGHVGHNGKNGHSNGHNGIHAANGTSAKDKSKDYRPTEKEPFMNERQKEYFRQKLAIWREDILKEAKDTLQHLQDENVNHPDLADRASSETDRAIELRARDRQRKLINKIDAALHRLDDGTYGYCEETGEPIGLKRLEARPIATLSVEAQERHERRERVYRDD